MSAIKYRVWWIPQVPGKPFRVEVRDLATAVALTETLAMYDLFQYDHGIKPDYANAGGVQAWDEDEMDWLDMDDDELPEPNVQVTR